MANWDTPENRRKYHQRYVAKHKEHVAKHNKEYQAKRRKDDPLLSTKNALMHQYGLTLEDKQRMYAEQDGKCAICKEPMSFSGQGCNVDHEHVDNFKTLSKENKKKYIRGLLCFKHNILLGCVDDNPEILKAAILYLEKYHV